MPLTRVRRNTIFTSLHFQLTALLFSQFFTWMNDCDRRQYQLLCDREVELVKSAVINVSNNLPTMADFNGPHINTPDKCALTYHQTHHEQRRRSSRHCLRQLPGRGASHEREKHQTIDGRSYVAAQQTQKNSLIPPLSSM